MPAITDAVTEATAGSPINDDGQRWSTAVAKTVNGGRPPLTTVGVNRRSMVGSGCHMAEG
ncbi:hypothetical protein Tco_0544540, partial [Tanacetum coccineum]